MPAIESMDRQVLVVENRSQPYHLVVGETVQVEIFAYLMPAQAALEVEARLSLPDGARLERATFGIAASPSNNTVAGSVADVRAGDAGSCVIDFGRMVTVSGVGVSSAARSITDVQQWTGAAWRYFTEDPSSFPEIVTERLLVSTTGSGDVERTMREEGSVWLPAQPSSLELVMDGSTVWFERQGSAADLVTKDANGADVVPGVSGFRVYGVDRTDALRDAFAKARSVDGSRDVNVKLRAGSPGELTLNASVSMLYEHTVTFGASSHSTTIDADDEGTRTLALPGPFTPSDQVREVALTLTGAFGPERVEPVDGPPIDDEAVLVLGAGRTMLIGVPSSLASLFGELQGVRLRLSSVKGGEIAGRLLTALGPDGRPGAAVKGAELAPFPVPAAQDGWFTLVLPKPVPVDVPEGSPVAAWLELVPSYGEISCALTTSMNPAEPGAPVLRRLPGGSTKGISSLQSAADPGQTTTLFAALRVIGLPGKRDPRPAVAVSVPGGTGTAFADPTGDSLRVVVGLGAGVAAQGGQLPLTIRVGAAGSVTADTVVVAYKKGGAP